MRKFFEGHSITGVAIILLAFVLALFLRYYDLASLSPWTDEVASWWYVRNPDLIFNHESHSPLLYGIFRVFLGGDASVESLRYFVATVSVIHLIECFFVGQLAFGKKQFLIFWILICLNPTDIVYARMARHYSWLLEGILIYYLLWRIHAPNWLKYFTSAFMSLLHVFAVIPIWTLAAIDFYKTRDNKELFKTVCFSSLGILYYFGRIVMVGKDAVGSSVSWNHASTFQFIKTTMAQFLGNAYPRQEFFQIPAALIVGVLVITVAYILSQKKPSSRHFALIALVSFLVVELLSFWINLRVGRYVIYLCGLWIVAWVDAQKDERHWEAPVTLGVMALYLLWFKPFLWFPWDREKMEEWRTFQVLHPASQELICTEHYQIEYYKLGKTSPCRWEINKINYGMPVNFLDLNGGDIPMMKSLMEKMNVLALEKIGPGAMINFGPKELHDKTN